MKIIKIQANGFSEQSKKYSFWLTIEGQQGSSLLNQNDKECQFKEGDEIPSEWLNEAKTSSKGSTYFLLSAPGSEKKQFFNKGGSNYKAEPFEHKAAGIAASYAKDLIIADKIQLTDFTRYFESIFNLIISKKVNQ